MDMINVKINGSAFATAATSTARPAILHFKELDKNFITIFPFPLFADIIPYPPPHCPMAGYRNRGTERNGAQNLTNTALWSEAPFVFSTCTFFGSPSLREKT